MFPNLGWLMRRARVNGSDLAVLLKISSSAFSQKFLGRTPFTPIERTRIAERFGYLESYVFSQPNPPASARFPRDRETAMLRPASETRSKDPQLAPELELKLARAIERINPVALLDALLFDGRVKDYVATCQRLFQLLRRRFGVTAPAFHTRVYTEPGMGYLYDPGPAIREGDSIQLEGGRVHPMTASEISEMLRLKASSSPAALRPAAGS